MTEARKGNEMPEKKHTKKKQTEKKKKKDGREVARNVAAAAGKALLTELRDEPAVRAVTEFARDVLPDREG